MVLWLSSYSQRECNELPYVGSSSVRQSADKTQNICKPGRQADREVEFAYMPLPG